MRIDTKSFLLEEFFVTADWPALTLAQRKLMKWGTRKIECRFWVEKIHLAGTKLFKNVGWPSRISDLWIEFITNLGFTFERLHWITIFLKLFASLHLLETEDYQVPNGLCANTPKQQSMLLRRQGVFPSYSILSLKMLKLGLILVKLFRLVLVISIKIFKNLFKYL